MNTKLDFGKHTLFTIFALLAALWLPSVSIAGDSSVDQINDQSVGFAETDPAVQQFHDVRAFSNAPKNQVIEVGVGFAETDPAAQQFLNAVDFLQASNGRVIDGAIGFAETDPAGSIYQLEKGTNFLPDKPTQLASE